MRPPHQLHGQLQLGRELRPVLGGDGAEVLVADVQPGQQGQGQGAPQRVRDQQPEDDPRVPVGERAAGRAGRRVVARPGLLHAQPIPFGQGVVEGQHQPRGAGQQGFDEFEQRARGGARCASSDRGRGRAAVLAGESGGANPTTEGLAPARQGQSEEQGGEPPGRAPSPARETTGAGVRVYARMSRPRPFGAGGRVVAPSSRAGRHSSTPHPTARPTLRLGKSRKVQPSPTRGKMPSDHGHRRTADQRRPRPRLARWRSLRHRASGVSDP